MPTFTDFDLDPRLNEALERCNYSSPTPVQEQAIPLASEGKDLIVCAATGTGKTAAFLLPVINKLAKSQGPGKGPRLLVLVPTRELAQQVATEAERYCQKLRHIKVVACYGGVPYPIQIRKLRRPHEILVATPGRLIEYLEQRRVRLDFVETLVLDEADRMLDMGFIDPVEHIASLTNSERQTLLFSATVDRRVRRLSTHLQREPQELSIKRDTSQRANIEQRLYYVDDVKHKLRLLIKLLEDESVKQGIVFTSTKRQAVQLTRSLVHAGYHCGALHGDMQQSQRTRTLDRLHKGKFQLLIATDVAGRGIDVEALTHVFNFDLPQQAEDYIHRIGRTGRAGATGIAITFATRREQGMIGRIQGITGQSLSPLSIPGYEASEKPYKASGSTGRKGPAKSRSRKGGWLARKKRSARKSRV